MQRQISSLISPFRNYARLTIASTLIRIYHYWKRGEQLSHEEFCLWKILLKNVNTYTNDFDDIWIKWEFLVSQSVKNTLKICFVIIFGYDYKVTKTAVNCFSSVIWWCQTMAQTTLVFRIVWVGKNCDHIYTHFMFYMN